MDINATLEKAPSKIAELAEDAEESRFIWKTAEIQQKQLEAKKHLELKALQPDLTISDLKANVEAEDGIYEKRMEVLTLESAYKKALIEVDKWSNAFNSARKIANLKIEEMRSLHSTIKAKEEI